jgi:hypothetical protein
MSRRKTALLDKIFNAATAGAESGRRYFKLSEKEPSVLIAEQEHGNRLVVSAKILLPRQDRLSLMNSRVSSFCSSQAVIC